MHDISTEKLYTAFSPLNAITFNINISRFKLHISAFVYTQAHAHTCRYHNIVLILNGIQETRTF